MATPFDAECKDCEAGQIRFFVEFKWRPNDDATALGCFDLWDDKLFEPKPGEFRFDTIRADNTQGYYVSGTRTFWVISCAKDEKEVKLFCDYLSKGFDGNYTHYKCLKPAEVVWPAGLGKRNTK